MEDGNSGLKFYLSQLDNSPLLTREEEGVLLQRIEVCQNTILKSCIDSAFFKSELLQLLSSQSLDDIIKISKKLNDESPKKEIKHVTNCFVDLVEALDKDQDPKDLLKEVALSGNIINTLVTRIKKRYAKIQDIEQKLSSLLKFFDVSNEKELIDRTTQIKNDRDARAFFMVKFQIDESRLLGKVHEYEELEQMRVAMTNSGVNQLNIDEIKTLYRNIADSEFNMKRSRDELIQKNLRLVVSRAKKFINRGLDFEDLLQEGNIGLIKAINKHDASRGTKIGTYATWWIDQAIRRAISNKSKTVRIPTHIEFFQSTMANAVSRLTQQLGRLPNRDEIAIEMKVASDVLEKLERVAMHKIGIEEDTGSGMSLLDILPADNTENPFTMTAKKMMRERIRQILSTLNPRTEKIIRLRFGIGEPYEELTLQEIADEVGLTKMGVAKLVHNKDLKRLIKKEDLDES